MEQIAGSGSDVTSGGVVPAAPGRRCGIALAAAALLASAGIVPAQAGNSWALPLVGGALGGYAISSFVNAR